MKIPSMTEPVMCVDIVIQSNNRMKRKNGRGGKKAGVSEWESEQETFQFTSTGFFPIVDVRTATEGVIHVG